MKKLKLICFCMLCFFFPLRGQNVSLDIKVDGDVLVYEVENGTPYYLMLFYTGEMNPGGGSYCLVNYEYGNSRRSDFLEADKRAIRIEPGEKYIRKFDISAYMNYKVIVISATAAMAVKDESGRTKPLKLRKSISF